MTAALLVTGAVQVGEQNAAPRLLGDRSARASDAERLSSLEQNVNRIGANYIASAFLAGCVGYLVAGLAQNLPWDRYVWLHVPVILWARTAAEVEEPAVTTCA